MHDLRYHQYLWKHIYLFFLYCYAQCIPLETQDLVIKTVSPQGTDLGTIKRGDTGRES